ncbi:MAG: NrsF family protein [Pseudomonadota bacterium]
MTARRDLITDLVDDLSPKPRQWPVLSIALLWWVLTWLYVVAVTAAFGPLREGVHHQIAHNHHFQVESLLGLFASLLFALIAWYSSIPGGATKKITIIASVTALAWLSFYIVGFWAPALEPSMHGKRLYCYLEAFVCSVPPTLLACYFIAKRYPLKRRQTGLAIGLAAGMIPALWMQFACMYEPAHILSHHILPGLFNGLLGLVLMPVVYAWVQKQATR